MLHYQLLSNVEQTFNLLEFCVPFASRKLVRADQLQTDSDERKLSDSDSTRKLDASSPELRNMEYTNHQYMSKIFQFLEKKLGMSASDATILNTSIQDKCIDMGNVHDFVDESRHPPWAEMYVEFGVLQEHAIVDSLENIRLLNSSRVAPVSWMLFRLLFFHRYSRIDQRSQTS